MCNQHRATNGFGHFFGLLEYLSSLRLSWGRKTSDGLGRSPWQIAIDASNVGTRGSDGTSGEVAARAAPACRPRREGGLSETGTREPQPRTREPHGDFPCIDGLRAFAACAVVLCHTAGVSNLITTTSGAYLAALRAGVQIFFVISGFVLYRPFAQAHRTKGRGPSLGGYFRRRFLRIFPAYWVVLTVGVYLLHVIVMTSDKATITNYLLVQSYVPQPSFYTGLLPAWTLVVEVTFYVFLPFYALAVWRTSRRSPLSAELAGCALLLVVGIACSAWVAFGSPPLWVTVLPANLAPFALGMALAVTKTHLHASTKSWSWSERAFGTPWKAWLVAAVAFSATVWAIHFPAVTTVALRIPDSTQFEYALLSSLMGLCVVAPAVFGDQYRGTGRRVLRAGPMVFLGIVSYGIYLWHFPVLIWTIQHNVYRELHGTPRINFFEVTAVTLGLTVLIATASWFLLEKPIIGFSHRPHLIRSGAGLRRRDAPSTADGAPNAPQ